ncbi:MAG: CAP domain-containing protein [Myxococcota bacterium]
MLCPARWALLLCPLVSACGIDPLTDVDLGESPACAGVAKWPTASADAELDLVDEIAELRLTGAECDGEMVDGVGPVELVPELHCAARLHAGDLIRHPELAVDHEGSDGSSALARANRAGYDGIARQEFLAGDFARASALALAWIESGTHCQQLLDEDIEHVGVGQAQTREGDRIVWVVVTGQERR